MSHVSSALDSTPLSGLRTLGAIAASLLLSTQAFGGFGVSSHDKGSPNGKSFHAAGALLDSNNETCWRVDPEQQNKGSYFYVDVPASTIDGLGMVIGWEKNEKTFKDYARVKSARVEIFNVTIGSDDLGAPLATADVNFEDKMGMQKVKIPETKVGTELAGGRVRVTITDVYEGKDFPALAVSEALVHLKEFPAKNIDFRGVPSSEVENHDGMMLIDESLKTFWAAEGYTAKMTFGASGFGLSSMDIVQGPKSYGRPKVVEIRANDSVVTHTLKDEPGKPQKVMLPTLVGFTGGAWGGIELEIKESYPGDVGKGTAISEVRLNAGSLEDI